MSQFKEGDKVVLQTDCCWLKRDVEYTVTKASDEWVSLDEVKYEHPSSRFKLAAPSLSDFKPGSRWRYTVEGVVDETGTFLDVENDAYTIKHSLLNGSFELLESAPDPEPEWDVARENATMNGVTLWWERRSDGEWANDELSDTYSSYSALKAARGPLTGYQKVDGDEK